MTLALCSIALLDLRLEEVARSARACGITALELTDRPQHVPADADAADAETLRQQLEDHGLSVLALGSYVGMGACRTPADVDRAVAVCGALRAPLLRVWAEATVPRAEVVRLLQDACDRATDVGIDVVIERHTHSFADTPARVDALLTDVARDNVGLNYQSLDDLPATAAAEQPDDARRLAPVSRYVHLKNYTPDPDTGRLRLGGGLRDGAIDLAAVVAGLRDGGYRGPFGIEFLERDGGTAAERLAAAVTFAAEVTATGPAAPDPPR